MTEKGIISSYIVIEINQKSNKNAAFYFKKCKIKRLKNLERFCKQVFLFN